MGSGPAAAVSVIGEIFALLRVIGVLYDKTTTTRRSTWWIDLIVRHEMDEGWTAPSS